MKTAPHLPNRRLASADFSLLGPPQANAPDTGGSPLSSPPPSRGRGRGRGGNAPPRQTTRSHLPRHANYLIALLTAAALAGCAVGPDYQRPEAPTARFKEAGDWKPAAPQDNAARGNWWELFGDPDLNPLVAAVELSNQNVQAAAAQYRQALAALGLSRSAYWPSLGASLGRSRAQGAASSSENTTAQADSPIRDNVRLALNASWEIDLWGRISRSAEAGDASAAASQADLRAALLSAQATLVQAYFQLRANDAQQALLAQTVAAYQRSLQITRNRFDAGVAGRIDVAQAETQLKTTEAQAVDLRLQRAQLEHAIAVLVGKAPSEFQLAADRALPTPPAIPPALPTTLLERRPDIAAAERRMAAANAQIGVARAAWFPSLSLSASAGYQNSTWAHLTSLPNRFWSVGPALALSLIDGGARAAQSDSAEASHDKAVASYRQTVLGAFQEVEDNLVALRRLEEEAALQQAAAQSAAEALRLTENQYQAGTVSYLNVVSAQAASLAAQRGTIDLANRRLLAGAALLKALGGNWQVPDKP